MDLTGFLSEFFAFEGDGFGRFDGEREALCFGATGRLLFFGGLSICIQYWIRHTAAIKNKMTNNHVGKGHINLFIIILNNAIAKVVMISRLSLSFHIVLSKNSKFNPMRPEWH